MMLLTMGNSTATFEVALKVVREKDEKLIFSCRFLLHIEMMNIRENSYFFAISFHYFSFRKNK